MNFKLPVLLLISALVLVQCNSEDPKPASLITDISPKSGQPATTVTITGSNFSKTPSKNEVTFNGVKATVTHATSTELIVMAPQASSGIVEVTVNNQKTTGPEFKYYNVYCYGSQSYYATYWKNGLASVFTSQGYIYDLAISGQDIHTVGYEATTEITPAYWKNGVKVPLPQLTAAGKLTGIAISGSDIYICGTDRPATGYQVVKCWKNGELIFATDGSNPAYVTDIKISGNDVFLIGNYYPNATVWKNGAGTQISNSTIHMPKQMRIVGTDIHIIGYEERDPMAVGYNDSFTPKYWKNGNLVSLPGNVKGAAGTLAIYNSDIYIGGFVYIKLSPTAEPNTIAKLWKNGEEVPLNETSTYSNISRYTESVEVTDDAVYVLTNQVGSSLRPYYSTLWKNGVAITPVYGPGVTGSISGMFIEYY